MKYRARSSKIKYQHSMIEGLRKLLEQIEPWEEIQSNRNRCGLGYIKDDDNLHILNYLKPIQFFSVELLEQITSASSQQLVDQRQYPQNEVADK